MSNWTRASFIAISRALFVLGMALAILGLKVPGIHGGEMFFGGLDCLVVAMGFRGFAASLWMHDRWMVVVRTNWRPYVWFA